MSGYQAIEKNRYSQNGAATTNQAVGQCHLKPEPTLEECIAEQIIASRDDYRSEQDLEAQRDMEMWAEHLLMVSLAQIPLGIFGLLALLYTIRQGREANQIARESSHQELRAYLTIASITIKEVNTDKSQYAMDLNVTNNGQTPATVSNINFTALWQFGWMGPSLDEKVAFHFLEYPLSMGAFSPEVIKEIIIERQSARGKDANE